MVSATEALVHRPDVGQGIRPGATEAVPLLLVHVEDCEVDARLFRELLRKIPFLKPPRVIRARSVAEACVAIRAQAPDCVLLDLRLPDAVGLSGLGAVRAVNEHAAILMLTSIDDEITAMEAVDHGAQDYLVKNSVDATVLGRAILRAMQRQQRMAELTARQRNAEYQATHDSLTGLANRRSFDGALERRCSASLEDLTEWGVVLLDLNGFKAINDNEGHVVGDEVLKVVGKRLGERVRDKDLVCRLGGDEFAMLVSTMPSANARAEMVQRLHDVVSEPIILNSKAYVVSASIGLACCPLDGTAPHVLMAEADRRMYADKRNGRAVGAR